MSTAVRSGTVTVTHSDNGTWLIALDGEHDIATQPLLNQRTDSIWSRCCVAIIDLSSADFICSSVIAWLHRVERELEAQGAFTLSIVEGPGDSATARTLALSGAHEQFACYATRDEARTQAPADPAEILVSSRSHLAPRNGEAQRSAAGRRSTNVTRGIE